jgi:UTP-glucose-1-phosphate uridylyltransferase
MKPSLVVLAAGMGSRFGGIKQIEPVGANGEIILEYSVFDAIKAGFGKVVFVLRKDIVDDFSRHVLSRFQDQIEVEIVLQSLDALPAGYTVPADRVKPWGTGHAVLMAAKACREPFAVINADDFYGHDAFMTIGAHLARTNSASTDFSMVGYQLSNTVSEHGSVSRGICSVTDDGFLAGVDEHTKLVKGPTGIISEREDGSKIAMSGQEIVSMNLFGFTPPIFPEIERQMVQFLESRGQKDLKAELYIPSVVNSMIQRGQARLQVLRSNASWFGITYKEDLALTRASIAGLLEQGAYPKRLWKP